ncbi:hypothetical protein MMC17_000567 [Xylographa soralifera]|nr:hypothetical protein [Xylographa soralifera]
MAKPSLVAVKRPNVEELLDEPQPDADIESDHDTDLADSDYDQQSVDLGDSPGEQLRRENMINVPMSKEDLTAVAVRAQRMLDISEDVADEMLSAERSATIFNSANQGHSRKTSGELAPAIVLETTASATKKRTLGSGAIQSPSKRLRGRPTRTAAVERPIRPLSPTVPSSGRLRRPTQRPTRNGGKITKARTAEEVYEVPEDSPLKSTISSLTNQENNDAVQKGREDTADDHSQSAVVKFTTEPKEANIRASLLPRKRGRPPKSSIKPSSNNEEKSPSALTHAHVPRPRSPIRPLNKPEKSANAIEKEKDLTKRLNGRSNGKKKPTTEEPSSASRSVSTKLVAEHGSVEPEVVCGQALKVSGEVNAILVKEAEDSRREEREDESYDDDLEFVDELSDEIENNSDKHSDRLELQEDVSNVPAEAERADDRDVQAVAVRLDREAGHASIALEIFGADERWKHVLQAARSVGLKKGRSVSSERRVGHNIPLMTNTIKKFLEKVKKVGLCYQQANSVENTNTQSQHNLRSRLRDYTLLLELAIENISQTKDATKNVERIQDIYVHAVPNMVFLLKNALNAQSTLYSADEEIESLKHVLGVQGLVVELCKKVGSLSESAKKKGQDLPISDLPIKAATSRRILPYLRDIGEIVETELDSIREETRRAREESARIEMYHVREARWQEKREQNRVEREQKLRQATKDALRLSGQPVMYTNRPYRQTPTELDQWTEDQDRELLRLLWDLGELPTERRYLIALNTPLLQNKLPEHIKRRALMLKPAIESNFGQNGLSIPEWVSSLV